ncbi:MAG TPA: serine/threonine-protein kinase [Thermoleophilaceae bacterium]|nr:serine/threonine-protein kinase [Thermoleophilaceae bacterium]
MEELPVGAVFAGHRIEAVVGRGGMGVVYVAVHQRLKQRRALKVIAPQYSRDEEFRRRFEREWEVAAAIDHPHVIPIHDAGEDGGQLYIAMRYVDGDDMRSLIARDGQLELAYTVGIVGQVAAALDAAHAQGLVHRDVKPANILLADAPDGAFAYLTDFGLTKGVDADTSGLTRTGVVVGTLDYMAPEQIDGEATFRSDVYALGCLTYHALTGRVPYPQPTASAKMWAHIHAPPPHLDVGSPELAAAVARAMAKDPADRFASAGEYAAALMAAIDGEDLPVTEALPPEVGEPTVSALRPAAAAAHDDRPPTSALPGRAHGTSRRPVAAAVVLATLLLGGVVAAVVSSGGDEAKPGTTAAAVKTREAPKPAVDSDREPRRASKAPKEASKPRSTRSSAAPSPASPAADARSSDSGDWPLDRRAYTVVLGSADTPAQAEATRQRAETSALPSIGVLHSDDFASLRPGYWVTFSGSYDDVSTAARAASVARDEGFSGAYARYVSPDGT